MPLGSRETPVVGKGLRSLGISITAGMPCPFVILVTIEDSAIMPEAFFAVDGDSYLPGVITRGPWGAAMGGQIVGGLLGWGIERSGIDPEFQPVRFSVV